MPRYTDRDVQNLISDIRHLINQPEVRHIAPLSCFMIDRRLLSFATDPWEELVRLDRQLWDRNQDDSTDAWIAKIQTVIDKAVELGLVIKVGE